MAAINRLRDLGLFQSTVPIGSVTAFAGATAPSGWLLCAGQTVSRTQYSGLFLTIGTTYGAGDGSTTFALPDLRGRVPAGLDNMGGSAANRLTAAGSGITGTTLGTTGGSETHTLTTAQMPSHSHQIKERGDGSGSFTALYSNTAGWGGGMFNSETTGSGSAHNNTQPTIILNYIIRAL